jgi:hypothetical protein
MRKKVLFLLAFYILTGISFVGTALVTSNSALAAAPPVPSGGTWIDRTYISVGGTYFRPTQTVSYDGTSNYYIPESAWKPKADQTKDICGVPYIDFSGLNFDKDGSKARYHNNYQAADSSCVKDTTGTVISLARADRRFVTAYKISDVNDDTHHATLYMPIYKKGVPSSVAEDVAGGTPEVTKTGGYFANRPKDSANGFNADDYPFYESGKWSDEKVDAAWITQSKNQLRTMGCLADGTCKQSNYGITLANGGAKTDPGTVDPIYKSVMANAAANDSLLQGNGDNGLVCNVPYISWIVCPLISIGYDVSTWLQGQVLDLLKPIPLDKTQAAWAQFRNLADALFILVFFVILFGNSLSIGIDAYTIKKALPRLVAAAIFVQFSFFLCQIAVDISSVLGTGLYTIIVNAIPGGAPQNGYQIIGIGEVLGATAAGGLALVLTPELAVGAFIMALLLILSFILAIFGAYFTLTFRLIVIQILVMAAPLAFVAWILPNTEKFFKIWWQNFSKMLMMYPMIAVLFAAGEFVNKVGGGESGNFSTHLGASLAPIVVLFVIPATFKLSGTALGAISGAVSARTGAASRSLKNSQAMKNTKQGLQENAAQHALNSTRTGALGRFTRGFGRVATGNAFSFGKVGQRKIQSTANIARMQADRDNQSLFNEYGVKNPALGELAAAAARGQKTFELEDSAGKKHEIKLTDQMLESAISRLAQNGGQTELANVLDGNVMSDAEAQAAGVARGSRKTSEGIYDRTLNGGKGGFRDAKTEAIWRRGLGTQSGTIGGQITHAVHGKGTSAYPLLGAAGVSSLKSGAADTYTSTVLSNSGDAQKALKDWITVTQSSDFAGRTDSEVAKQFRERALASGIYQGQTIAVDGQDMGVEQWLSEAIDSGGKVNYKLSDIKLNDGGATTPPGSAPSPGGGTPSGGGVTPPPGPTPTPPPTPPPGPTPGPAGTSGGGPAPTVGS